MSRKSLVWIAMFVLVTATAGCKPKPPEAPPEVIDVETTEVDEPAEDVVEQPTPTVDDTEEEALPEDLVDLNQVIRDRGLIGDVYFALDKFDLRADAREQLAQNAQFMRQHPELLFTIEGHCDERGTNEYNLALGQRRASAAKDYLISLSVDGPALRTISYGEERPVCTASDEACWQRNRRAHFVVTGRR